MITDSSPKSIAKEILRSLEKSPIKPRNLEAEASRRDRITTRRKLDFRGHLRSIDG